MRLYPTNWLMMLVIMTVGVGAMANPTHPKGNMPSAENIKGHMFFEKNNGQLTATSGETADNVLYYATTPKFSWYLTTEGIQYSFVDKSSERRGYYRLDLNYLNADFSHVKEGAEAAKVNHYRAGNQGPTMSLVKELTVQNFYPNIDLQILATTTGFKYNYVVKPGGDPNNIQMSYSAHDNADVLKSGEFVVSTRYGEVVESRPFSYQWQNGEKVETPSSFRYQEGSLSFELGDYDPSKTLVIDPIIEIQTYLGGASDDEIFGIDNNDDDQGNLDSVKIYVTGYTTYNNYPSGTGYTYASGSPANKDAFVACLEQDLTTLNWITFFAGSEDEVGRGVVEMRDSSYKRYLFIAGETNSGDFPVLNGTQMVHGGGYDAFVCKLNARTGRSRQWRTFLGGTDDDFATDVDVFDNTVSIGGYASSTTFFGGIGGAVPSTVNNGGVDVFLTRLSEDGGFLDAGTFIGTSLDEYSHAVGYTGNGGVLYTVGAGDNGTDMDAKAWSFDVTMAGAITALYTGTYGVAGDGNQIAYDADNQHNGAHGDDLVIVGSTDADPNFSNEQNSYNPGTGGNPLDGFVLTTDGALAEEHSLFSAGDKNDYFNAVIMRDGLSNGWNDPGLWTAVGVTYDDLDAFYDSDAGYGVYMSEYTCGSSMVGFSLSGSGDMDRYWGGYLDCNTEPHTITYGWDAAGDIDCGVVHVGGSTTNSSLSYTSGAHDNSIGGSLDGFVSKFDMRMEPKLFYDNNIFCRGSGVTQAFSSTPVSNTYKYTKVWGYPKGGHVYGDGVYYDENNSYYVFHADSGTNATIKNLTYRLGLWSCGPTEIDDDMQVVYARFIPWYMVICDPASGNNPGVDSARFNSNGYVPGGSGITTSYEWYKNANTTPVLETSTKWLFYKPALSDYVQGKVHFTGGTITGGCGIPSSKYLVDYDTSRIKLQMQHAYDYYETGSAINIDINRSSSWWRYFDWSAGSYTGYSWKKGVFPSGTSVGTAGTSLDINAQGQGSYYIEGRSKCETAAGPPATVTHRDKYATLSANNHCRTPQHENVNDNNSAGWVHTRVKEPDGSDYFSGTATHYMLKGRIDILPGVNLTLSSAELTMHPGTEINIYPGATMQLTNCQITTCDSDNPWDFVRVIGADGASIHVNGAFYTYGTTGLPLIEHGRIGLYSHNDGHLDINNTFFEHNKVHIYVYGNEDESNISIQNSVFGDPQEYSVSYSTINSIYSVYNGEKAYILGERSDHMNVEGNMFFGTTTDMDYSGIVMQSGSDNALQSNEFEDGFLDYAIHCTDADNYTIAYNNVCNTKSTQGGCHIGTGLYMGYTTGAGNILSAVVENNLKYMPVGMVYLHDNPPSGYNSSCRLNVFKGNTVGLYLATDELSYRLYGCQAGCSSTNSSSTTNSINLSIDCNDFFNNDVGVLGYGKLIDQGSSSTSHGNDWGGTSSLDNYHYDVLWGAGVTNWYSNSDAPNSSVTSSAPDYCISCTNYGYSDLATNVLTPAATTQACTPVPPFMSLDDPADGVSVDLYPNPFSNEVFVDINAPEFGGDMHVTMYDLQGRIIYSRQNVPSGLLAIPTGSVGKGAYIMKVSLENEAPQLFRIIKH